MILLIFILVGLLVCAPMLLVAWAAGEFSSVVSVENEGLRFPATLSTGEVVTYRRGGWHFSNGSPCAHALNCKISEKLGWTR